jgi:WD40 repeat protein
MHRYLLKILTTGLLLTNSIPFITVNPIIAQEAANAENVWISSLNWSDDQQLLATQSQGLLLRPGKLVKLTAAEPQKLEVLGEAETSLWSLLTMENSVVTSDYKGHLIRFEGNKPNLIELNARWMRCLVKVPNNPKEILAGTEDGQLIVVSTENWTEARRSKIEPAAAVFDIAFHPSHNQIAVAMGDGNVQILAWPGLEKQSTLKGAGAIWSCLYSQDGSQLITGGADRKIRLWDVASATPIVAIASARDWVTSMQSLPNTSFIVAGCMNGDVMLVDYVTKLPVKTHKGIASGIWDLALSADGKRIAVGTRKHGVQILDCSSWNDEAIAAANVAAADKPPQPLQ